ncbi:MAG: general secretion pathway protein GspB [Syntrophobacteraceae bacterium]
MSNTFDTLKRPYQAREAGSPQCRRIVPLPERRDSKRGARRHLLALALVFSACLLLWRLGPWPSGEGSNRRSEPASSSQPLQSAKIARPSSSSPEWQKLAPERLDQADEMVASTALESERPLDPPPELLYERPSLQRARAIRSELGTEPVAREPTAEELDGMPARRLNRSQARSIALSDLADRLPPAYSTKLNQPEAAESVSVERPDPPKWPEPTEAEKSAKLPARQTPDGGGTKKPDAALETASDKAAASGQPLRYQDVPSQIRDSIPLSISMLVYSKRPDDRWANINGSKMREGEQMLSGPSVEEIAPDGVVFSYQGHRFYKTMKGD